MTRSHHCTRHAKSGSLHLWCLLLLALATGVILMSPALSHASDPFDFEAMWNYSAPAETESKFRTTLKATEQPPNSEYVLQLQTQIARTLGLQRKFDEASPNSRGGATALYFHRRPLPKLRSCSGSRNGRDSLPLGGPTG